MGIWRSEEVVIVFVHEVIHYIEADIHYIEQTSLFRS
jgi:hypothetical protein